MTWGPAARGLVLASLACTVGWSASAQPPTPTHPGLVYGVLDGTPIRLDLYIPTAGTPPRPCVVWIHGGGWQGGTRANIPSGALQLRNLGIAVVSVDYRLTSQSGQYGSLPVIFPAQIEDVKGAVRWLRANAATYGLDATRFGSWGSSAGGHLSALLGTSAGVASLEGATGGNLGQSSAVQAFADYFGPTDILRIADMVTTPPGSTINHDAYNSPESRLIGWDDPGQGLGNVKANLTNPAAPYPQLVALARSVDPITHLSAGDPPAFIAHGTNDTSVPIGQSRALADSMTAAGLVATYRAVEGAGHGSLGTATDSLVAEFFRQAFALPPVSVAPLASRLARLVATPNPSRGAVSLVLPGAFARGDVLTIHDLAGRRVRRLAPAAGSSAASWDGCDEEGRPLAAGIYLGHLVRRDGRTAVVRVAVAP